MGKHGGDRKKEILVKYIYKRILETILKRIVCGKNMTLLRLYVTYIYIKNKKIKAYPNHRLTVHQCSPNLLTFFLCWQNADLILIWAKAIPMEFLYEKD